MVATVTVPGTIGFGDHVSVIWIDYALAGIINQPEQVIAALIEDIGPGRAFTATAAFVDGAVIPDATALAEGRLDYVIRHPFAESLEFDVPLGGGADLGRRGGIDEAKTPKCMEGKVGEIPGDCDHPAIHDQVVGSLHRENFALEPGEHGYTGLRSIRFRTIALR